MIPHSTASVKIEQNSNGEINNKPFPTKVEPKQEKPLVVYQDPELNLDGIIYLIFYLYFYLCQNTGSYWATFDPNQKRKKERVLSDLTGIDSGIKLYKNKTGFNNNDQNRLLEQKKYTSSPKETPASPCVIR